VRNDPGSEINPLRSIIPVDGRSFIVGKYSEEGAKKAVGKPADPVEISENKKLMIKSMSTRGGELMPGYVMSAIGPVKVQSIPPLPKLEAKMAKILKNKPKTGKAKKAKAEKIEPYLDENYLQEVQSKLLEQENEYAIPEEKEEKFVETYPVIFDIESGNIRSTVDSILEDEMAVMLVYRDEEHVSYVPKKGGKLTLILPGKRKVPVMYLGIRFSWYTNDQQLLVFLKTNIEE
jgi:hypothetical protein